MKINVNNNEDGSTFFKKIKNIVTNKQKEIAEEVATNMVEMIKNEIEFGIYETNDPGFTALGIVDTRKYLNSIKFVLEGSRFEATARVGSDDEKAIDVEYGTTGSQNASLDNQTMINWARNKGIEPANKIGANIAQKIRQQGTVEKPAFRRAIQTFKNSNWYYIKDDIVLSYENEIDNI